MLDPPRKRTAGPDTTRTPPPKMPPPGSTTAESLARERVQAIDRRCRIARMADELMPMAVHYRQPRGCFYCLVTEGWAA
jgi:hypothetical protein